MRASSPEPRRDVVALVVAGREASRVIEERRNAGERRGSVVAVLPRALGCPEVLTALAALGDLEQQSLDAGVMDQLQAARRRAALLPRRPSPRMELGDEMSSGRPGRCMPTERPQRKRRRPSFASMAIGSGGMISTVSNPMARQPAPPPQSRSMFVTMSSTSRSFRKADSNFVMPPTTRMSRRAQNRRSSCVRRLTRCRASRASAS